MVEKNNKTMKVSSELKLNPFASLFFVLLILNHNVIAQELLYEYGLAGRFSILPKPAIEINNQVVIPVSINKDNIVDVGLVFAGADSKITQAYRFSGDDRYAINQIIPSQSGSLLIAGEGYSKNKQESFYFMEFSDGRVLNSFVFNEGGNELDPFSITEVSNKSILIAGFVKNRELVGNFDFPIHSEEQMLYLGEFEKQGKKNWSIGITVPGFENPSATRVENVGNGYVVLGSAIKNTKTNTWIIRTDLKGNIVRMLSFEVNGGDFNSSTMISAKNQIWVCSKLSLLEKNYLALSSFDFNLNESVSYLIPCSGRPMPSTLSFKDEMLYVSSAISNQNGDYDFLAIRVDLNNSSYQHLIWGGRSIERLTDMTTEMAIGHVTNPNREYASLIKFFKPFDWQGVDKLKMASFNLTTTEIRNHKSTRKFSQSRINEGVSKLKVVSLMPDLRLLEKTVRP